MNDGYGKMNSRESVRANSRQKMMEAAHSSNNAFVRTHEAMTAVMGGKAPNLKEEAMHFNAYMCNNGEHAQDFARDLTAGLDKKAYPVK
jgi:hypothetical protein